MVLAFSDKWLRLAVFASLLIGASILAQANTAHAGVYLAETTNELPNRSMVTNYTPGSCPFGVCVTGNEGYLVVGSGEFDVSLFLVTYDAPDPSGFTINIEHGAICNQPRSGNTTGVDAPDNGNNPTTVFATLPAQFGSLAPMSFTSAGRDCGNVNRSVSVGPGQLTPMPNGRFGGVFVAALTGVTNGRSQQNSFKMRASDGDVRLGYSKYAADAAVASMRDIRNRCGTTAVADCNTLDWLAPKWRSVADNDYPTSISIANTDIPSNTYSDYGLSFRLDCKTPSLPAGNLKIRFYDADNGVLQGWGSGYPDLRFELTSVPVGNPGAWPTSHYSRQLTGGDKQIDDILDLPQLDTGLTYRARVTGLSRPNALQFALKLDGASLTNEPDPVCANPALPRCTINSITNSVGNTNILPGQQIVFNVSTANATGYVMGVNGPTADPAHVNDPAWGVHPNYLVNGSQYIRTPVPGDTGGFVVALYSFTDGGPYNQAMYAPGTPGTYPFSWGIVLPGVGWSPFSCQGQLTVQQPQPADGAICAGTSITSGPVARGRPFTMRVSYTNVGTNTWTPGAWNLGSAAGLTNNYVTNAGGEIRGATVPGNIPPGGTATFTVNLTAPSTNGSYPVYWLMVHEAVTWFGQPQCGQNIDVTDPVDTAPSSVLISQNCAAPFTITIRVTDSDGIENTGQALVNYSVDGAARTGNTTGGGTVRTLTFNMPDPTVPVSVSASSTGLNPQPPGGVGAAGSNRSFPLTSFPACAAGFTLTSQPQTPVLDDSETPTTASFTAPIGFAGSANRVNGVNTTREFFFNRGGTYDGTTGTIVGGATTPLGANLTGPYDIFPKPVSNVLGTVSRNGWPTVTTGDMICVRLTISPSAGLVTFAGNQIAGYVNGSSARLQCAVILNKPYLRAYGGDLIAGAGFGSSCPAENSSIIGFARERTTAPLGWVGAGTQLGAFTSGTGTIQQFATNNLTSPTDPSALAFANTGAVGTTFGTAFGGRFCADDFWSSRDTTLTTTPGVPPPLNSLASGQYQYAAGSTVRTTGYVGSRIAIYVDGDVTVTGTDISVTNTWASLNDIPSFYLVVRGNIYIEPTVRQLEGIYVAMPNAASPLGGGRIFTCTDNGANPTVAALTGPCRTNKLLVIGALTATRVNLLRTGGSLRDAPFGETILSPNIAEVYKYVPEMYLTVPAPRARTQVGTFDSVVTLPPAL